MGRHGRYVWKPMVHSVFHGLNRGRHGSVYTTEHTMRHPMVYVMVCLMTCAIGQPVVLSKVVYTYGVRRGACLLYTSPSPRD